MLSRSLVGSVLLLLASLLPAAEAAKAHPSTLVQPHAETTVPLRTHSLYAPYVDSDLQNRWWDFGADTIINTNKAVRLTQDQPSEMGWLWSRLPLTSTNYQVEFEFKVDSKASVIFGDGFGMWLTKERAQPGPVFGSKDQFNGLGIFFDTYANSRHSYTFPRISAMMGDGKRNYDHATDGAVSEFAGCSANIRSKDDVATKARLTYIKGSYLQLELHYKAWDEWTSCFKENVTMPANPYLGFTALTGQVSEYHDIISVSSSSAILTTNNPMTQGVKTKKKKGSSYKPRGGGGVSWFLFFLKGIALVVIAGFGYSAYAKYAAKKEKQNRSKRAW